MFFPATVVWTVLIAVEVLHGIGRALSLIPLVGDLRSRQIGVRTGSIISVVMAMLHDVAHGGWLALGMAALALSFGLSAKARHLVP